MIPATALRIGNIVHAKDLDGNLKYIRVEEIKRKNGVYVFIDQDGIGYLEKAVKGVELNAEILEKAGFINEYTVEYRIAVDLPNVEFTGSLQVLDNNKVFWIKNFKIQAQYLHQLQNLYWILTGEELKIEL